MNSPARSLVDDDSLKKIASQVELSYSYLVYMIAAGVLASVALLTNSVPILIGSMIVAPLMPPLALIPFGLVHHRRTQAARGLHVALVGLLLAFLATWATTALMDAFGVMASEAVLLNRPLLQERVHPGWWSMAAAVAAGLAGTIAQAHEKTDALIGTVASLALVPAVGASAVALYLGEPAAALGGLLLLGINIGLIIAMGVTAVLLPTGRRGLGRPLALLPVAILVIAALLVVWAQETGTVPETPARSSSTSSNTHASSPGATDDR